MATRTPPRSPPVHNPSPVSISADTLCPPQTTSEFTHHTIVPEGVPRPSLYRNQLHAGIPTASTMTRPYVIVHGVEKSNSSQGHSLSGK